MAHSLGNISDKNYQHRPMHVEVTVCNIGVVFFLRHSVYTRLAADC